MKEKIKGFIKNGLYFLGLILILWAILLVFRFDPYQNDLNYNEGWIVFIGGILIGYLIYYIREKTKKEEEYWKKEKESSTDFKSY